MNRRDLLKRVAALGLVAATPKLWPLDQTMFNPPNVRVYENGEMVFQFYADFHEPWTPMKIEGLQLWWQAEGGLIFPVETG